MKNTAITTLSISILTMLAVGCSKKKVAVAPISPVVDEVEGRQSRYFGLWEGKEKTGDIYTFRFTNTEWEAHLEKDGSSIPYYKGTYTFTGSRLDLLITEQADLRTVGWIPQKGNIGPNITGRLSGGKLEIKALTEAVLEKKR